MSRRKQVSDGYRHLRMVLVCDACGARLGVWELGASEGRMPAASLRMTGAKDGDPEGAEPTRVRYECRCGAQPVVTFDRMREAYERVLASDTRGSVEFRI